MEMRKWIQELDQHTRLMMELKRRLEDTILKPEIQETDYEDMLKEINKLSSKATSLLASSVMLMGYMEHIINKINGGE